MSTIAALSARFFGFANAATNNAALGRPASVSAGNANGTVGLNQLSTEFDPLSQQINNPPLFNNLSQVVSFPTFAESVQQDLVTPTFAEQAVENANSTQAQIAAADGGTNANSGTTQGTTANGTTQTNGNGAATGGNAANRTGRQGLSFAQRIIDGLQNLSFAQRITQAAERRANDANIVGVNAETVRGRPQEELRGFAPVPGRLEVQGGPRLAQAAAQTAATAAAAAPQPAPAAAPGAAGAGVPATGPAVPPTNGALANIGLNGTLLDLLV